jgi:CRP/FNR family transcriptional regulator
MIPSMHTDTALTQAVQFVRPAPAVYARTLGGVQPETRCSACPLKDQCLPAGLSHADAQRLDGLQFARRKVKEGEILYTAGQDFTFVYAVRSGTIKSVLLTNDGREQVSGFALSGDVLGLDGVATGRHASTAIALEDTEVCTIPYSQLAHLAAGHPAMYLSLTRLLGGEIVRDHQLALLLGSLTAEERVCAFLVNVSDRMKARGWSAAEFHLRMSRADIGSFLGLTIETISRTFSSLKRQRLIDVDKKHVRILDIDAVRAMSAQTLH